QPFADGVLEPEAGDERPAALALARHASIKGGIPMPVIRLSEVPELAEIGPDIDTLVMKKAIGSPSRDPNFKMPVATESLSVTYITIFGRLRQITCDESDRAMFIVNGQAIVKVGEDAPAHVSQGDFVLIPRRTPYEFK